LVYLASQIRQNSKLLRASTASATLAATSDFTSLVVQDSEVARIFREGVADCSSLTDDDNVRFGALLGMQFTAHNQEYEFFADGVMGLSAWENRVRAIQTTMCCRVAPSTDVSPPSLPVDASPFRTLVALT
jgi:hypothetical protein